MDESIIGGAAMACKTALRQPAVVAAIAGAVFVAALSTSHPGGSAYSGGATDSTAFLPVAANRVDDLGELPIAQPDPLEEFFSLEAIHNLEIEVAEDGVDSLRERPRLYVHAQVTIDGRKFANVGLRLKGGAGSFIPIDGDRPPVSGDGNGKPGKSAFIIDFNRYVSGVDYFGLEKLTLNNLVQDPSCIHEYVGYRLFRAGGVPASRIGYGVISFNGEDKGLYALVETPDNDEFLERWYSSSQGNLYEGQYGVDLRSETVLEYDQDNGADESRRDLYALVDALDAIEPGTDPLVVLDRHFDVDEYLTFAATELYLGHWDGYAWSTNNYMIHHDLASDDWTFLPWGIDQTFVDPLGEHSGVMRHRGPAWEPGPGGRIHELCFRSEECRDRLHGAFVELLKRIDDVDLLGVAEDARHLVGPLAMQEAREYGNPELTVEALNRVSRHISQRSDEVSAWLPCLIGEAVDRDRDGYDGCREDCDDLDPKVHPGAAETCNIRDDDCNGVIDDPEECPKCIEVEGPDSYTYGLCFNAKSWPAASLYCQERDESLASIHSEPSQEFLTSSLAERLGMPEAWIGLNDRESEGVFRWTDGTALDFERWAPYAPQRYGEESDCVLSLPDGWVDIGCEEPHVFVCRGPEPRE